MAFVKICSITNIDDALAAAASGADYLGFIAVPNTPRYVTPQEYGAIAARLPASVTPVVVVRDAPDALPYSPVAVQYYGGDPSSLSAHVKLLPVIRPRNIEELAVLDRLPSKAVGVVVDAYNPEKLGGTGEVSNWIVAAEAVRRTKLNVFLAGGLNAENVALAIREVRPHGVDVSSGVEASVGRKDHAKVAAFIAAAKAQPT